MPSWYGGCLAKYRQTAVRFWAIVTDVNPGGGMAGVLVDIFSVLGVMVLGISLLLLASRLIVKRWSRNMAVSDDSRYAETLTTLSEASVRRSFDPYTDINWDAEEFSVTANSCASQLMSVYGSKLRRTEPSDRVVNVSA